MSNIMVDGKKMSQSFHRMGLFVLWAGWDGADPGGRGRPASRPAAEQLVGVEALRANGDQDVVFSDFQRSFVTESGDALDVVSRRTLVSERVLGANVVLFGGHSSFFGVR